MVKIKTKDFILRPLKLSDARNYYEASIDPESKKNFTTYPKNFNEAKKEVKEMLNEVKEKDSEIFTIIVNKKYAGNVTLQHQDFDVNSKEGRVHLLVHPNFRGKGFGTKALNEVVKYGFKKKFKRIFAQCKAINKGIIKINKKLGFKKLKNYTNEEGVKKILWVKEN